MHEVDRHSSGVVFSIFFRPSVSLVNQRIPILMVRFARSI